MNRWQYYNGHIYFVQRDDEKILTAMFTVISDPTGQGAWLRSSAGHIRYL